jgi:hypothetical protein
MSNKCELAPSLVSAAMRSCIASTTRSLCGLPKGSPLGRAPDVARENIVLVKTMAARLVNTC